MSALNKKVYGVLGIASYMSNFNADFTGYPRSVDDEFFASNGAGKYTLRNYWNKNGEKVFYFKSFTDVKGKLTPRDIKERYEFMFNKKISDVESIEVLGDLFSCIDVMNFGSAFAVQGKNISITGAVQFTEAYNKYSNTEVIRKEILSPFQNSNSKGEQTTLGSQIIADEMHYFYGFSVNPYTYDEYQGLIKNFKGYTKEAYEAFKEGSLYGASELGSVSKNGCENEFALFVECKEGAKPSMANLQRYVKFTKEKDEKGKIDLEELSKYLLYFNSTIDKIQVYINPFTIKINLDPLKEFKVDFFNILDRKPIVEK